MSWLVINSIILLASGLGSGQILYNKSLYSSVSQSLFIVQMNPILSMSIGVMQLIVLKYKRVHYTSFVFVLYLMLLHSSCYILILGSRTSSIAICERLSSFCFTKTCTEGEGDFSSLIYMSAVYISLLISIVGPGALFKCRFKDKDRNIVTPDTFATLDTRWAHFTGTIPGRRSASVSFNSASSVSTTRGHKKVAKSSFNENIIEENLSDDDVDGEEKDDDASITNPSKMRTGIETGQKLEYSQTEDKDDHFDHSSQNSER